MPVYDFMNAPVSRPLHEIVPALALVHVPVSDPARQPEPKHELEPEPEPEPEPEIGA